MRGHKQQEMDSWCSLSIRRKYSGTTRASQSVRAPAGGGGAPRPAQPRKRAGVVRSDAYRQAGEGNHGLDAEQPELAGADDISRKDDPMAVMTGLSGNEMYCLHLKGLQPGDLVIGNSVFSVGFVGGIGSGLRTLARRRGHADHQRHPRRPPAVLCTHGRRGPAARRRRASPASPTSCAHSRQHRVPLRRLLRASRRTARPSSSRFSTSARRAGALLPDRRRLHADQVRLRQRRLLHRRRRRHHGRAQEPGARRDHGVQPGLQPDAPPRAGADHGEAAAVGGNAVVGIKTSIMPFQGMQEMLMLGTASLPSLSAGASTARTRSPAT